MSKLKKEAKETSSKQEVPSKRTYLKQSDVPAGSLTEALRVPQAIVDHYASKPTAPLFVAKALNVDPKGSQLKVLTGAAIAFGLIEGGAQATSISVTELAKRILKPKIEGDDIIARRQSVLTPRIFKDFLTNYDGSPFPRQDIALNVLEDMGVPPDKVTEVLNRIMESAKAVGFIEEIKGKSYVTLQGTAQSTFQTEPEINEENNDSQEEDERPEKNYKTNPQ